MKNNFVREIKSIAGLILIAGLSIQASAQERMAIVGGRVLPVCAAAIENGTVLVENGKILAVGGPETKAPEGFTRFDASGKTVTPGLIDAYGFTGLVQVELDKATNDSAEKGAYSFPQGRVLDSFSPEVKSLAMTRPSGVTAMGVAPQSGDLFAGQSALFSLGRGALDDMLLKSPLFLHATLGEEAKGGEGGDDKKKPSTRMGTIAKLRALLAEAQAYQREQEGFRKKTAAAGKGDEGDKSPPARDLGKETLVLALEGALPVAVNADRADDILAALRVAAEFKLKLLIVGGAEAWKTAGELRAAGVPVILTHTSKRGSSQAASLARPDSARLLLDAGVRVGFGSGEIFNSRDLGFWAAQLEAYGLTFDQALKLVTQGNAEVLGIAELTGSLAPGKRADLVVWDGEPLEIGGHPALILAGGRKIGPGAPAN